jgi:hypothetical protein
MNNAHLKVRRSFVTAAIVSGINASVSVGFAVASVAKAQTTTSWYAADRAAVLLVILVVVATRRSRTGLLATGWGLVLVQAADAVIGGAAGDVSKTVGPAILAIATAAALLVDSRAGRDTSRDATSVIP